jgi:hypothetical protein
MPHIFVARHREDLKRGKRTEHTKEGLGLHAAACSEFYQLNITSNWDSIRDCEIGDNPKHLRDLKASYQKIQGHSFADYLL